MNHLYERVAYLKGLADGLGIEESSKEGKLLIHIIDILEDFADALVEVSEEQDDIKDYIEAMDEDLSDVEDELFEEDDEDEYDDHEDEEDEDIDFVEVECPNCHEEVFIDEDLVYEDEVDVVCPRCHEPINIDDFEFDDHDGCCGGHCHDKEE